MEIENRDSYCLERDRDQCHDQERRLRSCSRQGDQKGNVMPRRKSPSSRTHATSKTLASTNASDDDDDFRQTTREDDDNNLDEMDDDDSDFGTLTVGTASVANSTICTSTLRFTSSLDNTSSSSVRNNGGRGRQQARLHPPRLHQPTLTQLQEGDDDDIPPLIREGLTTDVVRAFMEDYYTDYTSCIDHYTRACWESFFDAKYDRERYVHMRASGNPLDADSLCELIVGGDARLLRLTLISLDEIKILAGGLAAIVVYTADQDFLFKGTLNRDRSITTAVIEEVNGECKIIQDHRSTGQPRPTQGRWSC